MIKSHPSEEVLQQFACGTLSSAFSLVVATHLDMCPHCKHTVDELEEQLAQQLLVEDKPLGQADCEAMLDKIFSSSEVQGFSADDRASIRQATNNLITLEGKRFQLPATLARQMDRIGPWNKMLGKLWRAPLDIGGNESINLIYMDNGANVPEHTHKGTEATLVLNGTFSDEFDTYHDGDFILLDGERQHSPKTASEDCLTLAVLDEPLHFTSGLSRLLNPFSNLFFR